MDLSAAKILYPNAETFTFGDTEALNCELLLLVRAGLKTATCEAMSSIENGNEAMPVVGRQDISLTFDGKAALVTETLSLEIKAFEDVEEDFALAEGEDEDLAGWRKGHKEYFERTSGFDPRMKILCERFRLVKDFGQEQS